MEAYKCPKCGYLNVIYMPHGASLKQCPDCNFDFTSDHRRKKVEVIDWEKELMPERYNYQIGA